MARGDDSRRSPLRSLGELVITVAVAVALALLIQAFVVKPYRIPSGSMIPTLKVGQRVLTNRLINHPSVGDVVVFHPPRGADLGNGVCGNPNQGGGHPAPCGTPTPQESSQTFIKRVVAGPGDRISIVDDHLIRNGVRESDGYIAARNSSACVGGVVSNFRQTITVPPGDYFMMGDNRECSDDSRFWGPVPDKWVIGVAFFTYWPPDRIGFL
jgi:signal peptidase I